MALRIMEEMEMARLIVQILHPLPCIRTKDYGSGIEKKENLVRGSVEERQKEGENKGIGNVGERQKERKSKGMSILDEIQHL